jgi:hypothetical protein
MKIFLAGEGPSELGDWSRLPQYRSSPPRRGVIEALLLRIRPQGWEIVGATCWKDILKFKAGGHASAEERDVLGAALQAVEKGCQVLAFTRDRDGDVQRGKDVERGVAKATEHHGSALSVAGGVAVEALESWILSLKGEQNTEGSKDPKQRFREVFVDNGGEGSTAAMVDFVAESNLDEKTLPVDARSLRQWLVGARRAMFPDQKSLVDAPLA